MGTATDKHLISWGLEQDLNIILDKDYDGRGFSETLKFSACKNIVVDGRGHLVTGGKEDCLDIVRGCGYTFKNIRFKIGDAKQHVTAKSGLHNVVFENCDFIGKPKTACVVLGQYSDYNILPMRKTQGIHFTDCVFDHPNKAIQTWYADSKKIFLNNTSAKINKIHPLIVWGYFTFRRIQDRISYGKYGRGGQTPQGIENVKRKICDC
jgi:hypothetical protein